MPISVLSGAHDFVLNLSLNVDSVGQPAYNNVGLEILLKAAYPEATHNSSDHPTSCFPGTREQYIEDITTWAVSGAERSFRMMWLQGLAGVGKSSLAQSCAERANTRLAATFFFSRPNNRDKPSHLFTSIAYQLTTRYPSYRDKLEQKIRNDPTLVQKSLPTQFRKLIIAPIQELQREGRGIEEGVIFIDGLDECAGEDAQCTIIDIIASSIRDQTTPFIWGFFSRPEPCILAQFSAPHIRNLCWQANLPVSRDADEEIEVYLRVAFKRIRVQYCTPSNTVWPSESDIGELVNRSAGLFIYPASIVRSVGKGGALGPEEQLRSILKRSVNSSGNPWSQLDAFYTLIMEQIPQETLVTTLKLLPSYEKLGEGSLMIAAVGLGFSSTTLAATLRKLHSVIKFPVDGELTSGALEFYHASFTDFLNDPGRSGSFYVKTPELCAELLGDLIKLYHRGFVTVVPVPWKDGDPEEQVEHNFEGSAIYAFWELGSYARLDDSLLEQLSEMDYRQMGPHNFNHEDAYMLYNNIPLAWRPKIMRPYYSALWQKLFRKNKPTLFPFVLGIGDKRNVLVNNLGFKKGCCFLSNYRRFGYMKRQTFNWRVCALFQRFIGKEETHFQVLVKEVGDLIELDAFQ